MDDFDGDIFGGTGVKNDFSKEVFVELEEVTLFLDEKVEGIPVNTA